MSLLAFAPPAAAKGSGGSKDGRFQVLQLGEMRRDHYLIDTHTGVLWNKVCAVSRKSDCAMHIWEKQYIQDVTESTKALDRRASELQKFIDEQEKSGPNQDSAQ